MAHALDARLIGPLLALVAHDLRNPLSALHSNVGFLESVAPPGDGDARDALADVTASCGSLKHIIDNLELLGLAAQDERPRLDRTPVSLFELTADVLSRVRLIAESYGVELAFEGEGQRGVRVLVHREMLARSVGNLLFNAIQHGGSSTPVLVQLASDKGFGVVQFSDGGSPLSEDLRTQAFTAEGQLVCKGEATGRYSRGLGLFAAFVAAELAGAEVQALSPLRGRNRFEVRARLA